MILDLEDGKVDVATLKPQVCIVGAGAVGLAAAVTLARRGVDVLVLEGGGAQLEASSQELQQGESLGHPFESIGIGRYRVLGGSTVYWGGQVIAFDEFVRGPRPWAGHDAWPVDPQELAACFVESLRLLGLGAVELADGAVWQGMGLPEPKLSAETELLLTRWVPVRNLARHLRSELRAGGSPRVLLHANVTGLELSDDGRRVAALHVRTRGGRSARVEAPHVVLANGTLEIARLLLHPLADGRPAPWHGSPWLARPLVDHLDCTAGDVHVLDQQRFHQLFDNLFLRGLKYFPRMRLAPSVQREQQLLDCGANFLYRTRFSEHLEVLKMFLRSLREGGMSGSVAGLPRHIAGVLGTAMPLAWRYFRDRRSFKPADAEVSLALYCEQLPNPASRIALGNERDALGMRRLQVHWAIDGRELRTMRVFAEIIARDLGAAGLAKVDIHPLLREESPQFLANIHDAVHQMGCARMGTTPETGFVDPHGCVHGLSNLHIAGAAVFPSSGFANPTLTAMALTLRLANRLAQQVAT